VAYTDHEIGRVISNSRPGQARQYADHLHQRRQRHVRRGRADGTPNEVAFFNGLNELPVEVQMKFYDVWEPTGPTTTCRPAGRGRSTRRSPGSSRTRHSSAASIRTWWCPGGAHLGKGGLREQFVTSSTWCRPSSRPRASRHRRCGWHQAGADRGHQLPVQPRRGPTRRRRPRHKRQYFEMMGQWARYDEGCC